MLLHQTAKLMIGSLQVPISEIFGLNNQQWGLINPGALIVATALYPIWGFLSDGYARAKLLSLASFICGATTWINAFMPTFGGFLVTRASTGIADYFGPTLRDKIYGIFCLARHLGCNPIKSARNRVFVVQNALNLEVRQYLKSSCT